MVPVVIDVAEAPQDRPTCGVSGPTPAIKRSKTNEYGEGVDTEASKVEAGSLSFCLYGFGPVFGQSWAQEPAKRPRLEKRYINQRTLAREIDSKARETKI